MQPPPPLPVRSSQPAAVTRLPPMRGSRPILAIDTAHSHANGNANGHPQLSVPRSAVTVNGEPLSAPVLNNTTAMHELSPKTTTSASQSRSSLCAHSHCFGRSARGSHVLACWAASVWVDRSEDRLLTPRRLYPQERSVSGPKRSRWHATSADVSSASAFPCADCRASTFSRRNCLGMQRGSSSAMAGGRHADSATSARIRATTRRTTSAVLLGASSGNSTAARARVTASKTRLERSITLRSPRRSRPHPPRHPHRTPEEAQT